MSFFRRRYSSTCFGFPVLIFFYMQLLTMKEDLTVLPHFQCFFRAATNRFDKHRFQPIKSVLVFCSVKVLRPSFLETL